MAKSKTTGYVVAVDNITVDGKAMSAGESCDSIRESVLAGMIRSGTAVKASAAPKKKASPRPPVEDPDADAG